MFVHIFGTFFFFNENKKKSFANQKVSFFHKLLCDSEHLLTRPSFLLQSFFCLVILQLWFC